MATKIITVKGVGNVSVKPDLIVVSMKLATEDREYEKTMELAAERISLINGSLEKIGFKKNSVKTTDFNVRTNYESVKDKSGNYKSVFKGIGARLRFQLGRAARDEQLAALHDADAVGKMLGFLHRMGGEQNGDLPLELFDDAPQFPAREDVKAERRLVKKKDFRIVDQGERNGHLSLPAP